MLASDFGTGQVFWSMLWFFLFFIWIWLLITVFSDIFRSHDMGGFAKFLWVIFVIFLPYLGVFVYLIARGHKMSEHAMEAARRTTPQHGLHPAGRRHERRRKLADELRAPRRPQGPGRHRRRRVHQDEGQDRRLSRRHATGARRDRQTDGSGGRRLSCSSRSIGAGTARPARSSLRYQNAALSEIDAVTMRPEDVRPQQQRERRADRAVGVGLPLDRTGEVEDRRRLQPGHPDRHHRGAGRERPPRTLGVRQQARRQQPDAERHRRREHERQDREERRLATQPRTIPAPTTSWVVTRPTTTPAAARRVRELRHRAPAR